MLHYPTRKLASSTPIALLCVCIISTTTPNVCHSKDDKHGTIPLAEVNTMIKKLNRQFEDASSLSYLVERSISTDKGTASDSWSFSYVKPGLLRIEYFKPEPRLIIKNNDHLWEYIRKNNCAMQIDISDYSAKEETEMLASAFKRVAVHGLKPGGFESLPDVPYKKQVDGDIVTISNMSKPRYLLKIDTSKNILLKTEIYDESGQLVIRSKTSKHKLISEDFWFPMLINNTVKTGDSYTETTVKLSAAKANHSIAKEIFTFKIPKNCRIIEK